MALVQSRATQFPQSRRWNTVVRADNSPFGDIDELFQQLVGQGQGGPRVATHYAVDVFETADDLMVEMAIPGVPSENLDISLEGRQLAIRGTLPEVTDEGRRYWLQGIARGDFSRTLMLPTSVDGERITAKVDQGMLRLTLPKRVEARARKIAVESV